MRFTCPPPTPQGFFPNVSPPPYSPPQNFWVFTLDPPPPLAGQVTPPLQDFGQLQVFERSQRILICFPPPSPRSGEWSVSGDFRPLGVTVYRAEIFGDRQRWTAGLLVFSLFLHVGMILRTRLFCLNHFRPQAPPCIFILLPHS